MSDTSGVDQAAADQAAADQASATKAAADRAASDRAAKAAADKAAADQAALDKAAADAAAAAPPPKLQLHGLVRWEAIAASLASHMEALVAEFERVRDLIHDVERDTPKK